MTSSTIKIGTIVGGSSNKTLSRGVDRVAFRVKGIPLPVHWSFLAFIFTLPFESTVAGSSSVSRLAGLLFFGCYFFSYNPVFQKRSFHPIPRALWWFLGYLAVYVAGAWWVAASIINDDELVQGLSGRFFTLVQSFVFFWIAAGLLKEKKVARSSVLAYALSSALFALATLLQLPGFGDSSIDGRVTGLGENPNALGTHMALAIISLIGLYLYGPYKKLMGRMLLALSIPALAALAGSGSRGALLSLGTGLMAYLIPLWRGSKRTIAAIFVALMAFAGVIYMVLNNSDFTERWEKTYYEGSLANRENIMPAAIEMFFEKPVFGWHPGQAFRELGSRNGVWVKDTHNLILALLIEVGVIGAIPFLVGLWLCALSAWQARSESLRLLPLALLLVILMSNMSGTNLVWKPQWLVLALASATTIKAKASGQLSRVRSVRQTN